MKFTNDCIRAFILGCLASTEGKSLADLVQDFEDVFSEFIQNGAEPFIGTHSARAKLIFSNVMYLIGITMVESDSIEVKVSGESRFKALPKNLTCLVDIYYLRHLVED